jgi:hypothetical protein
MTRERLDELEAQIVLALAQPSLDETDKEVLRLLALHKGAQNAIKSARIAELVRLPEGEHGRRAVASAVEHLVQITEVPIGGLRVPPYGYFLVVTAKDLDLAIHSRWGEVFAHLRYLRKLAGRHRVAEMFGQTMMKLDKSDPGETA